MKKLQRVLSFFLTIAMSVSFLSAAVYADDTDMTGTESAYADMEESAVDSVAEVPEEEEAVPSAPAEETPEVTEQPEATETPAATDTPMPEVTPEVTPEATEPVEATPEATAPVEVTPEPEEEPSEEDNLDEMYILYDDGMSVDLAMAPAYAMVTGERIGNTDLYWSLDDATGVLTITGTGTLPDYSGTASSKVSAISFTTAPWYRYRPYIKSIVIEDGVTGIGAYAFYSVYKELTSLTVPASVESIGAYAFYNNAKLATINFAEGSKLSNIGNKAFHSTEWLDNNTDGFVRAGTTLILYLADEENPAATVTIPDGITTIGDYAFYQQSAIRRIVLPSTITGIGNYAFYRCTALTEINIPASVKNLGSYSFYNCAELSRVNLESGSALTGIGDHAFYNCVKLVRMDLSLTGDLRTIGAYAFYNCASITNLTIPGAVEEIGGYAFRNCKKITHVEFPASVRVIGNHAFSGCEMLTSITFNGETPPAIGAETFTDVTANVTYNTTNTTEWATFIDKDYGGHLTWIGTGSFDEDSDLSWNLDTDGILHVSGSTGIPNYTEINSAPWYTIRAKIKAVDIQEGVTSIGDYAFFNCPNVESVSVAASVAHIGEAAFKNCTGLRTVTFGEGSVLESVGASAFHTCEVLESMTLPETVRSIGSYAFYYCGSMTSINIPDGVSTIEEHTFNGCYSLSSIMLPDSITGIGTYAFYDCMVLADVTFGGNVQLSYVGSYAFNNTPWLEANDYAIVVNGQLLTYMGSRTNYTTGADVTVIGADAFKNNTSLQRVTILPQVRTIGDSAFAGCTNITAVIFQNSDQSQLESIGDYAFDGCKKLTGITIPRGDLGDYAFNGCVALASATFGTSSIGDYAFNGCTKLTDATINSGTLGAHAFQGCTAEGLAVTLGETVTAVGAGAFQGSALASITVSATAVSFGDEAFRDCAALETFTMNEGAAISGVGAYCFVGCDALELGDFVIDSGAIGAHAFQGVSIVGITTNSVSSIGEEAFADCAELQSAMLNAADDTDTALNIGTRAFAGCSDLTVFNCGAATKSIGSYAFQDCAALKYVTLDGGAVGSYAFQGCAALSEVTLGSNVTSIGVDAFRGLETLTTITSTATALQIAEHAFTGCSGLTTFTITTGAAVTSVGAEAFMDCVKLGSTLTITGDVAENAFKGCAGLKSAITVTGSIAAGAFQGSAISSLTVGKSGETSDIGAAALSGVTGLTTLTIASGATVTVAEEAFNGCTGLTTLTNNGSIASVAARAFQNCSKLTSAVTIAGGAIGARAFYGAGITGVTIAAPVTEVGTEAFKGAGLTAMTVNATALHIASNAFENCTNLAAVTFGADARVNGIDGAAFKGCSKLLNFKIDTGVVGAQAFYGCAAMTSVTFGADVTDISSEAFRGCTKLANVTFPANLKTIANAAFYGCAAMTAVTVPASVEALGNDAFRACTGLTSATINSKTIGTYAFQGCSKLATVTLGTGVTTVGDYAFNGDAALKTLNLNAAALTIGYASFQNCTAFTTVNMGAGANIVGVGAHGLRNTRITSLTIASGVIANDALRDNSGLVTLTIGSGVTSLGAAAVYNCTNLKTVVMESGSIGSQAFEACSSLAAVTLGDGVTSIASRAFYNIKTLKSIAIGKSVRSIGENAFYGCEGLSSVAFAPGGRLEEIGNYAFKYCRSLSSLTFPANLKSIGVQAFYFVSTLKSLDFEEGATLEYVGSQAFYKCTLLTEAKLPASAQSVASNAFQFCSELKTLVLPSFVALTDVTGVTDLTVLSGVITGAPCGLSSLTTLTLGEGVISISGGAFSGASNLKTVKFLGKFPTITGSPFSGVTSAAATYPAAYASSWSGKTSSSFYGGTGWAWSQSSGSTAPSVIASGTVSGVSWKVYNNGLLELTGSGTVPAYSTSANAPWFSNRASITRLTAANGVSLSAASLTGLPLLEHVELASGAALSGSYTSDFGTGWSIQRELTGGAGVYGPKDGVLTITAASALNVTANGAAPWNSSREHIAQVVSTVNAVVPGPALYGFSALKTVTVPSGVNQASVSYVFTMGVAGATATWEMTTPMAQVSASGGTVSYAGTGQNLTMAFRGTGAIYGYNRININENDSGYSLPPWYGYNGTLTNLVVGEGITRIGNQALYGFSRLSSVSFPSTLTSIGGYAFASCSNLTSVTLPEGFQDFEVASFSGCSRLASIHFPSTMRTVAQWSLDGNSACTLMEFAPKSGLRMNFVYQSIGASSLSTFVFKGDTMPSFNNETLTGSPNARCVYVYSDNASALNTLTSTVWGGALMAKALYNANSYGTCGSTLTWALCADGTLDINGTGAMTNFASASAAPWNAYAAQIKKINLSTEITSIGSYAFQNCTNLTSVSFQSASRPAVGTGAFSGRTFTATYLPVYASAYPTGDTTYGGASRVTWTAGTYGGQLTPTASWSLDMNTHTLTISGTGTMTQFGNASAAPWFAYRGSIQKVVIESGITTIAACAFADNGYAITNVSIPNTVTTIGVSAFYNLTSLKELSMPDSITGLGDTAFSYSGIEKIKMSAGIRDISNCFTQCHSLKFVYLPNFTGTGGWGSFQHCSNLEYVYAPKLTYIGAYAFNNCPKLKYIYAPNVTSINRWGLANCGFVNSGSRPSTNPYTAYETYAGLTNDEFWSNSSYNDLYLPALRSTEIAPFEGCRQLKTVNFTNLTNLAYRSFNGCTSLVSATLPNVTTVAYQSFYGCSALTTVNMPKVQTMEYGVFQNCTSLTKVVTTMGSDNVGVTLPTTLTTMGVNNFQGCTKLTSVSWPSSIAVIPEYTFTGCTGLKAFTIPEGVTGVGAYAFQNTALEDIQLPHSMTTIGDYMFSGLSSLVKYDVPSWVTRIGVGAFQGCPKLAAVTLNSGLQNVSLNAFQGCSALRSITFPSTAIPTISTSAFSGLTMNGYYKEADAGLWANQSETLGGAAHIDWTCLTKPADSIPGGTSPDGTHEATLTWTLDANGTLVIGGEGGLPDYSGASATPWYASRASIKTIIVENGVTNVGNYAFAGLTAATAATVESGTPRIGSYAFSGSTALASVSLPASVTAMGDYVFDGCTKLATVNIPANMTSIPAYTFRNCTGLTTLTMSGAKVATVGTHAFENAGCPALTVDLSAQPITSIKAEAFNNAKMGTLKFGSTTVTELGSNAIANCPNLTAYVMPRYGTTASGVNAANGFTALQSVTLPAGTVTVGENAFNGLTTLTTVNFANCTGTLTTIGNSAFAGCTGLTTLEGFSSCAKLNTLGSNVFQNCRALTSIPFSASATLTSIGSGVFTGCSGLTTLVLPNGWKTIHANPTSAEDPTSQFTSLESITIPASVTAIEANAFNGCANLTSVTFTGAPGLNSLGISAFQGCTKLNTLTNFENCTNLTELVEGVFAGNSLTSITIPESVTTIDKGAFRQSENLTSITIPASVTTIGEEAFAGSTKLSSITFPEGTKLATIGERAFAQTAASKLTGFENCTMTRISDGAFSGSNLASFTFPASVTEIGKRVFKNCVKLESITIPAAITLIDANAFEGCSVLHEVNFTEGSRLAELGQQAFLNAHVTELDFRNCTALVKIGEGAFEGCQYMTGIYFSNTEVQQIGSGKDIDGKPAGSDIFKGCRSLQSLVLPNGWTVVSGFNDLGLNSITLPTTVTTIADNAFDGSASLTEIIFNAENLITIGNRAFAGTGLAAADLSQCVNLKSFGDGVFTGCAELASVVLPASVKIIPDRTFESCTNLTSYTIPASITDIGGSAFARSGLVNVTIPGGVESIQDGAFTSCENLVTVTFQSGSQLNYLGTDAFTACDNLETIHFDFASDLDHVIFQQGAFSGTNKLTTVEGIDHNFYYSKLYFGNGCAVADEDALTMEKVSSVNITYTRDGETFSYAADSYTASDEDVFSLTNTYALQTNDLGMFAYIAAIDASKDGTLARALESVIEHTSTTKTGQLKDWGCTVDGYQLHQCDDCPYQMAVLDPAKGHVIRHDVGAPANCTTPGRTEYYYCARPDCGKYFSDEEGTTEISYTDTVEAKLGHDMETHDEVLPTCTNTGHVKYYECQREDCGLLSYDKEGENTIKNVTDTYTSAEGHNIVHVVDSPTSDRTYYYCTKCLRVYNTDAAGAENIEGAVVVSYNAQGTGNVVFDTYSTAGVNVVADCNLTNAILSKYLRMASYSNPNNTHNGKNPLPDECYTDADRRVDQYDLYLAKAGEIRFMNIEGVPSIYMNAFADGKYSSLQSVTADETLRGIMPRAFAGCTTLTEFNFPNSVQNIQNSAFEGTGLLTVELPASIANIGNGAFYGCTNLKTFIIPTGNIRFASSDILAGCTSLATINYMGEQSSWKNLAGFMPEGVAIHFNNNALGNGTVVTLTADKTLEFTASSGTIIPGNTEEVFSGVTYNALSFGANIHHIEAGAFQNVTKLNAVTLTTNMETIGDNAFKSAKIGTTNYMEGTAVGSHAKWYAMEIGVGNEALAAALPASVTNHNTQLVEETASTCTEHGQKAHWKCEECGYLFDENNDRITDVSTLELPLEPHSPKVESSLSQNCLGERVLVRIYRCTKCGNCFSDAECTKPMQESETKLSKNGHQLRFYEAVAPSCVADGNNAYYRCNYCQKYFADVEGDTELNYEQDVYLAKDPNAHKLTYTPAVPATCTKTGVGAYYVCENGCGENGANKMFSNASAQEEITEPRVIPATNHKGTLVLVERVEPTCTEVGRVAYWQCSACGAKFEYVDSDGFTVEGTEGVDAYYGHVGPGFVGSSKAIAALGHNVIHVDGTPATCSSKEDGIREHYKCQRCGKIFLNPKATIELFTVALEKDTHLMKNIGGTSPYAYCTKCKEVAHVDYSYVEDGETKYAYTSLEGYTQYVANETDGTQFIFQLIDNTATVFAADSKSTTLRNVANPFAEDYTVTRLVVGDGITTIGNLTGMDDVTTVQLSDKVETIDDRAFENWPSLRRVNLENVKSIGNYAFAGCSSFNQELAINGQEDIGDYVFQNSGVTSMMITKAPSYMGDHVFEGCKLKKVVYEDELNEWVTIRYGSGLATGGNPEFDNFEPGVEFTNRNLNEGWTFDFADDIITLIPDGAADKTKLPTNLAYGINIIGATGVVIPDGVTKIVADDFDTLISTVTIPHSVTTIDDDVFSKSELKAVTYDGDFADWYALTANNTVLSDPSLAVTYLRFFGNNPDLTEEQIISVKISTDVEAGTVSITVTGNGDGIIPDIASEADSPFCRLESRLGKKIVSFAIGEGVSTVGSNLLLGLDSIEDFSLSEGVRSIGNNVLGDYVSGMSVYTLPSTVASVGTGNFTANVTVLLNVSGETDSSEMTAQYDALIAQEGNGLSENNFWVRGDVDGNHCVNGMDAAMIAQIAIGSVSLSDLKVTEAQRNLISLACNIDGNGALTIVDAMLIARVLVGYDYPTSSTEI